MKLEDLPGKTIAVLMQLPRGQALITDDGKVLLCHDLRVADAMTSIEVLRQAYGYRQIVPRKKLENAEPTLDKPAPFIETTIAEQDETPPTEFDMGPADKPWLNKVHGLAHATPNEKIEGWDER